MALTYNKNDDEIVPCKEFSLDAEARLAESFLKNEGISCFIESDFFSTIYPMPFGSPLGGARLMVKNRDLERARQLIDSLNLEGF